MATSCRKLSLYVYLNFWDEQDELFFFTDKNAEALIVRKKEIFDNVIPSSNSMMAKNFYTLGLILDREDFTDLSKLMVGKMKEILTKNADYLTNWACLASQLVTPTVEIAIVGEEYLTFRAKIDQKYFPNKVLSATKDKSELPPLNIERHLMGKPTFMFVLTKHVADLSKLSRRLGNKFYNSKMVSQKVDHFYFMAFIP
jgi:uncharacterized protein YyaL (SSP411 family)